MIPYTSTILILCGFQGAVAPQSLVGLSGDYYFFGCVAMNVAGIAEFILGNSPSPTHSGSIIADYDEAFPMAVFLIYGSHWGSLAYTQDPIHNTTAPFAELGGAHGAAYNSSQGFHNVTMYVSRIFSHYTLTLNRAIASFVFLIGTLRVNLFFTFTFFGLVMLFSFIAAADFSVASATTEAGLLHVEKLLRIAGGFGFLGLVSGWYLAILTACEAVGIPCPLPVLDLSSKVFPSKTKTGKDS